jgi:4'-phosphopantetheinyl transferase
LARSEEEERTIAPTWIPGKENGPPPDAGETAYSTLAANEAHVWLIPLSGQEYRDPSEFSPLSEDEVQRAHRFHFERDRFRFVAARAAMRNILAQYLGTAPEELTFSYSPMGKPELAPDFRTPALRFNLSHSRDFALLALARHSRVGADIEFVDVERATRDIANRFFSPAEITTLEALPAAARVEAFFECWTRKEAYLKALGAGLSVPLDSFDVAFGPGVPPALLRLGESSNETSPWSLYDIVAPPGYKAAIVVEGLHHQLRLRDWQSRRQA